MVVRAQGGKKHLGHEALDEPSSLHGDGMLRGAAVDAVDVPHDEEGCHVKDGRYGPNDQPA